jgi:arginyl-tRNA synthetase
MLELPASVVSRVDVAGPGFINFWLADTALTKVVWRILRSGQEYGRSATGEGNSVLVVFASPNPSESLYVGHGRCAVLGDAIASLLKATGHNVVREFVADDAPGRIALHAEQVRDFEDVGIRFDRITRRSQADAVDPDGDVSSRPPEYGVRIDRNGVPWQRIRVDAPARQPVALREFFERVGVDAARYFFLAGRDAAQPAVAVDLAAVQSEDNPVYYVQYAHARLAGVFHRDDVVLQGITDDAARVLESLAPDARKFIRLLALYPVVVARAARAREPHRIVAYLESVARMANDWHQARFKLGAPQPGQRAEIALTRAALIVLANALTLLGISAPERM